MTNAVTNINDAAQSVVVNWTVIITVITVCLTAMGTLIKIFSRGDYDSSKDLLIQQKSQEIATLTNESKENKEKLEKVKETTNQIQSEIKLLQQENAVQNKNIEEIKSNNRAIVNKLDDLLRQLMEWMSE